MILATVLPEVSSMRQQEKQECQACQLTTCHVAVLARKTPTLFSTVHHPTCPSEVLKEATSRVSLHLGGQISLTTMATSLALALQRRGRTTTSGSCARRQNTGETRNGPKGNEVPRRPQRKLCTVVQPERHISGRRLYLRRPAWCAPMRRRGAERFTRLELPAFLLTFFVPRCQSSREFSCWTRTPRNLV